MFFVCIIIGLMAFSLGYICGLREGYKFRSDEVKAEGI